MSQSSRPGPSGWGRRFARQDCLERPRPGSRRKRATTSRLVIFDEADSPGSAGSVLENLDFLGPCVSADAAHLSYAPATPAHKFLRAEDLTRILRTARCGIQRFCETEVARCSIARDVL